MPVSKAERLAEDTGAVVKALLKRTPVGGLCPARHGGVGHTGPAGHELPPSQ